MPPRVKTPARPLAVLELPEYEVPLLITLARGIVEATSKSPHFPSPIPPLAVVRAAIDDLEKAEIVVATRLKGSKETRDEKRLVVTQMLDQLRAYVQGVADGDLAEAASIIESAGMRVKKRRGPAPRVFTVKQGRARGCVLLIAPQAANRASYEWAYSLDGGKTWIVLPITVEANTQVEGLPLGATVLFRYRTATKDGVSDWSAPISFIVV
jgi:hypothetical protein